MEQALASAFENYTRKVVQQVIREETPQNNKELCTPLSCSFNEQLKRLADIRSWISTVMEFAFKGQLGQVENLLAFGIDHYDLHSVFPPRFHFCPVSVNLALGSPASVVCLTTTRRTTMCFLPASKPGRRITFHAILQLLRGGKYVIPRCL